MTTPHAQSTLSGHLRQDTASGLRRLAPGLTILAHPDRERIGEAVALTALASGSPVALSRLEPAFAAIGRSARCRPLDDPYLSRRPLSLRPGPGPGEVTLDDAETRTRVRVGAGGDAAPPARSFSPADLDRGVILVLNQRVVLLLHRVDPIPAALPRFGLVGDSTALARLRAEIRSAAGLEVPILLRGETGTGKELVARALHDAGPRCRGPFLALNVATLPPALAASELFGAARGAYTGADRAKAGYFQSARGGTLFLDEIGETAVEVQALLLRALEAGEIQPVGSAAAVPIDVRVIAATDADLETAIEESRFRAPLLHRLAGYEIALPALRHRRDDIARLLDRFLGQELAALGVAPPPAGAAPWPPAALVARLVDDDWPGNVRQLRNVARRLAVARRDGLDDAALLQMVDTWLRVPRGKRSSTPATPASEHPGPEDRRRRRAAEVSEAELLEVLAAHRWCPRPAARALGVSPPALYRLIDRCPKVRKAGELGHDEIAAALSACGGDLGAAAARLEVSRLGLRRRMTALGLG